MPNRAMNAYKQNSIKTASPADLTMMLYNGAIKFMNISKIAIEEGDIQKRSDSLLRAQDIISELKFSLNNEFEISKELDSLYAFVLEKLIDANISNDTKSLDEAIDIVQEMRETWKEVMIKSKANPS